MHPHSTGLVHMQGGFNLIAIYPFSDSSSLLLAMAVDQVWPGFLVTGA